MPRWICADCLTVFGCVHYTRCACGCPKCGRPTGAYALGSDMGQRLQEMADKRNKA